ncbi:MAG TPA: BCCT family transporter [Arenicellales bacterium]|nr:BCCT family transporter [Arenicellales bacterium]
MADDRYSTDYEVGQDNVEKFGMDIHHPVFAIAAVLILVFVIGTLIFPESAKVAFDGSKNWSIENFDWLFMLGGNIFVIFIIALLFLPVGKVRLGGPDAKPEHSTIAWFGMLFAAGMGIGLMFWSVAEPANYFTASPPWTPLGVEGGTAEARELALGATMFHWGLHPWAIYGVVALSLAFFTFNKGLPLTIRSTFFPIIGDSAWGWPGHIIDIVAVLATIFGLATSLGFGAQQAASGLAFLFDVPNTINTQIAVIVGVTAVAVISVVRGIEGGVKVLSNINMAIAGVLLLFVFLAGSTLAILGSMGTLASEYVQNIIPFSNWVGREDETWMRGWTVFYWAWWISWSPFVGMFIARVSYGRTVRGFVTAVLLVPTLITVIWMGTFGGSGLDQIQNGIGKLAGESLDNTLAMFWMLENLPLTAISSFIAIVLVLVFFVTSSDSGSLVIDSITAGGKLDAPVPQRIFWATMEGLIAGALLFGGGGDALGALQAAAVTTGLPFTIVLIVMCIGLYMGLHSEKDEH